MGEDLFLQTCFPTGLPHLWVGFHHLPNSSSWKSECHPELLCFTQHPSHSPHPPAYLFVPPYPYPNSVSFSLWSSPILQATIWPSPWWESLLISAFPLPTYAHLGTRISFAKCTGHVSPAKSPPCPPQEFLSSCLCNPSPIGSGVHDASAQQSFRPFDAPSSFGTAGLGTGSSRGGGWGEALPPARGPTQCLLVSAEVPLLCAPCSVVSNSLQLHGRWPARLLCPWDFPGRKTGVGGHSPLQGIFPTQGSNPWLLGLLPCRQILHCGVVRDAPCHS